MMKKINIVRWLCLSKPLNKVISTILNTCNDKHNFIFIKKNFLSAIFNICVFSSSVFAFDFGGILSNDSSFQTFSEGKFYFDQKNSISLWARQNFNKAGENYFAVEGTYNFESDFEQKNSDKFSNFLDLDLLEINFTKTFYSSKVNFEVGRFYFYDLSGLIFTQNADGVKIDFQNNYFTASIYGSYTGLLNANKTKIISATPKQFLINGELPAVEDSSKIFIADSSKIYDLNEKYAVADFSLSFPYFYANQTFFTEFLGAFRLENEKYNRIYATFGFDGPIYESLFYDLSSTFEFLNYKYEENYENGEKVLKSENKIANLSKIALTYYLKNASIELSGIYASGNQGLFSSFVGFSKNASTYSLQNFLYVGIIKTGISAKIKPLENILISANCDTIFNALSNNNKNDNFNKIKYYGFEFAIDVIYQVKSDFQLGTNFCQFIDRNNSNEAKKSYINLHATLAF